MTKSLKNLNLNYATILADDLRRGKFKVESLVFLSLPDKLSVETLGWGEIMWKNLIETESSRALEKAMDYSAYRSSLLSQNVANVNTPNYKRSDIDFSALLDQTLAASQLAMTSTNRKHFGGNPATPTAPSVIKDDSRTMRFDGNNVDVEYEMSKVAENSLFYQSLTSSWKSEMSRLKMVIEGKG